MASGSGFFATVRRFMSDYMATLAAHGPMGELLARARHDAALRRRLVESPEQVLAEAGVSLPAGLKVEVVENSERVIHIVLPPLAAS